MMDNSEPLEAAPSVLVVLEPSTEVVTPDRVETIEEQIEEIAIVTVVTAEMFVALEARVAMLEAERPHETHEAPATPPTEEETLPEEVPVETVEPAEEPAIEPPTEVVIHNRRYRRI